MRAKPGYIWLIGGMVYDREGHQATDSVRRISPVSLGRNVAWTESGHRKLSKVRAFACAVATRDGRVAVLGGHTEIGGELERSGEILFGPQLPDMIQPREIFPGFVLNGWIMMVLNQLSYATA